MRTLLRSVAGAAVLTSIAVTATACSSSSGAADAYGAKAAPSVASLVTTTAAADPSPTAATRPRLRLDMTSDEEEAVMNRYYKCMKQHGLDTVDAKRAQDRQTQKGGAKNADADACYQQYFPQQPWEEDPANPDSRKFFQLAVQCLKNKGVRYVDAGPDGHVLEFGGPKNDARSISLGMQYADACERDAAQQLK